MTTLYCQKCQKGTQHYRLPRTGFIGQLAIAVITGFSADLREYDYECTCCGTKRN